MINLLPRNLAQRIRQSNQKKTIESALDRYFIQGKRDQNIIISDADVIPDGRAEWIPGMLAHNDIHDADYIIFKYFQDPTATILDIGANYGYSVASIWKTGCKANILSFEPLKFYGACLDQIKHLRPTTYDYRNYGLGDTNDQVNFVTPTVNGMAITALTTADPDPSIKGLVKNINDHINWHMKNLSGVSIKMYKFETSVKRLDDVLATEAFNIPMEQIEAIKMDVEGFEANVIEGARETIERHKPLFLIESGNRDRKVAALLEAAGYIYAEREGEQIIPFEGLSTQENGFFLHPSKIGQYTKLGLMR